MMLVALICVIMALLGMNIFLWSTGSVGKAEKPELLLDNPVMEAKERKAILKRLKRWKEEGKLSTEEHETIQQLIQSEWNL